MNGRKLAGKVALVTGGSRGLGAAIAVALADKGAHVAVSYVFSAEKARTVADQVATKGVRAAARADQGDVSQSEGLNLNSQLSTGPNEPY
jgi:3-oxoacyl-[acyl-carrier protein] reductase